MRRHADFKRLWGYSVGFYGVWVAHVGRRMGLFEQIAKAPLSVSSLITKTGLNERAVRVWCSAAQSYDLVQEKNGKLRMTPSMKALLVDRKNPDYLGGQFSYLALRSLEYGGFEDLFRSGRTREMALTMDAIEQATDWDHYAVISAIKKDRKLHSLLSKGCRVLDVGCGTASFLEKMHDAYPRSEFVGVEPFGAAAKQAKKRAQGRPIKILQQAGEEMKFEQEFDLAYLGESLYAALDKQKVVSNCRRALKKGGTIAVVEGLLPDRQNDENRLIVGMQLDFALQGYQFMRRPELVQLLRRAGFTKIRLSDLGGAVYLATAKVL